MDRRIAILGTGANGSCAAADLIRAGFDVTLIDQWPAHVEAMRADGLRIEVAGGTVRIDGVRAHHVCDVATFRHRFDIVLVMTKAYDARWMAELIRPCLADDGLLIGAQNSMTAGDLAGIVGAHRNIGCVVELSSELFTPGIVRRNSPNEGTWFALGALDRSMGRRVEDAAEIFRHIGNVAICDDILSAKWMKLIVNAMTMPVRSMMGMRTGEVAGVPGARELMLRAGEEALAAGQAEGYRVVPIFGFSSDEIEGSNRYLEMLIDKLFKDVGSGSRNAMLQDVLKGRRTEADMLNGLVVETCRRHGLSAPVNAALADVMNRISAGELQPGVENLERVLAVASR
jgi:2-dehydropantoate 2-reductase